MAASAGWARVPAVGPIPELYRHPAPLDSPTLQFGEELFWVLADIQGRGQDESPGAAGLGAGSARTEVMFQFGKRTSANACFQTSQCPVYSSYRTFGRRPAACLQVAQRSSPTNEGWRFPRKAATPSRKSLPCNEAAISRSASATPSPRVWPSAR